MHLGLNNRPSVPLHTDLRNMIKLDLQTSAPQVQIFSGGEGRREVLRSMIAMSRRPCCGDWVRIFDVLLFVSVVTYLGSDMHQ